VLLERHLCIRQRLKPSWDYLLKNAFIVWLVWWAFLLGEALYFVRILKGKNNG